MKRKEDSLFIWMKLGLTRMTSLGEFGTIIRLRQLIQSLLGKGPAGL
jgi:hypothetical protein